MGGRFFRVRYSCLSSCALYVFGSVYLSLFMLFAALMGLEVMKATYAHAVEEGYCFYSYGDASVLIP